MRPRALAKSDMLSIEDKGRRADTKAAILSTATRLFAASGTDAVAIRDIAEAAGVNGAAINYHFGSKDQLIRSIFRDLFLQLNRERLQALEACELRGGEGVSADGVIRALVEPTVRFCMNAEGGGIYFPRLLFHAYGLKHQHVDESIAEQVDHIVLRFVSALEQALPDVSRADLFWRFDFAIGACFRVLVDPYRQHRLRRLSGGLCDTDDGDMIIEQLVTSIKASFAHDR